MLKSVSVLENQFVGDVQRLKGVSFASETRLKCVCLCVTFHILIQLSGSDLLKGASSSAQASSLFLCLPLSAHLPSPLPNLTYKSSAHNNLMGNNWIFFPPPTTTTTSLLHRRLLLLTHARCRAYWSVWEAAVQRWWNSNMAVAVVSVYCVNLGWFQLTRIPA